MPKCMGEWIGACTLTNPVPDQEFAAIETLYKALEPLSDEARTRVLAYISARLEITPPVQQAAQGPAPPASTVNPEEEARLVQEEAKAPKYGSFAELFDAAAPSSAADKALVAGYWLQVCGGAGSFDGFSANRELKNLGHGVGNITNAIEALRNQQPAHALQLAKSGKSQQARKTYKLTVAGIKAVEDMISG
jgi:hypothetical protein